MLLRATEGGWRAAGTSQPSKGSGGSLSCFHRLVAMNRQVKLAPLPREAAGSRQRCRFIHGASCFLSGKGRPAKVLGQAYKLHLCAISSKTIAYGVGSFRTVSLGDKEGGGLCHLSGSLGCRSGGLGSRPCPKTWLRYTQKTTHQTNKQIFFSLMRGSRNRTGTW